MGCEWSDAIPQIVPCCAECTLRHWYHWYYLYQYINPHQLGQLDQFQWHQWYQWYQWHQWYQWSQLHQHQLHQHQLHQLQLDQDQLQLDQDQNFISPEMVLPADVVLEIGPNIVVENYEPFERPVEPYTEFGADIWRATESDCLPKLQCC